MNNTQSPWIHRSAVALALSTLFLIFVGGLVTSTDSGLAVPDWPLSYGRLMPPMIGGIFYEHGHRMVAATVGFLTILFALMVTFRSNKRWLKKMAWLAVGMVCLQGLLGGLTVLFRLPPFISIFHACLAQTFLCLVVALAVWTSPFWDSNPKNLFDPKGSTPIFKIAVAFFGLSYLQLVLGAVLRHTGHGLIFHIACAFMVAAAAWWLTHRTSKQGTEHVGFKQLTILCLVAVLFQITLGFTTYFLIGHEFSVIPIPMPAILTITAHVSTGALVLSLSLIAMLAAFRMKPAKDTSPSPTKISDYFELTKPGITMTAGITALAGYVLGSQGQINFLQLVHTGIGTLLISAGACTLNMLIEKDVDARMKRTKKRPLPSGRLKTGEALFLGSFLSVISLVYLSWAVNILTAFLAGLTFSIYLYVYTPLKKVSSFCITVGAVAGALPPVIGWAAATGKLGWEPLVLFGILFFWQFPHFFSLAWLYKDDYKQAGLHMLPRIEDNGTTTAVSICINSVALIIVSILPTIMGLTGVIYMFAAIGLGLWILFFSFVFYKDRSYSSARKLFFASLAYVPILVIPMVLKI